MMRSSPGIVLPMKALAVLAVLLVGSCAGPSDAYVAADRATFEAIAPAHRAYLEADATLDAEQRARRLAVLATWELRIRHAAPNKAVSR